MAVSKNNPNARAHQRLVAYCPLCRTELQLIKRVPGGMQYVCPKDGHSIPVSKGTYKTLEHAWVRK